MRGTALGHMGSRDGMKTTGEGDSLPEGIDSWNLVASVKRGSQQVLWLERLAICPPNRGRRESMASRMTFANQVSVGPCH